MIDSHAHVTMPQFDNDRLAVIERACQAGLKGWVEVGTDLKQSKRAIALARKYTGRAPQHFDVWASVGVHPSDVSRLTEGVWSSLENLLTDDAVVAIGEVGLDFYRGGTAEQQIPVLERFVELALKYSLPIIWHVRDGVSNNAHNELILFLTKLPDDRRPRGVIHTFSGTSDQAESYLKLGLYLSFSGVVTFSSAGSSATVAKSVPLHRLLIETDCPFLAPIPQRGQRNEPAYVRYVAEHIARLRGIPTEKVQSQSEQNTRELFNL